MRTEVITCDKCGQRSAKPLYFDGGRFTDAAGQADTRQYSVDICDKCLRTTIINTIYKANVTNFFVTFINELPLSDTIKLDIISAYRR